jgi:microcystin degradation protein MlrC
MIPHYAPCLNLNLPNSGRGQAKTARAPQPNAMTDKKDPAQGGVQGDEKQKQTIHTHNKGSHAQSTFPKPDAVPALGKAGLATRLVLAVGCYQFSSVTRLVRWPSKLVVRR